MKFLLLMILSLSFISCAHYEERSPSSERSDERTRDEYLDNYGNFYR